MNNASSENRFIQPEEFLKQIGLKANQTLVHLGCGAGFYLIPAAHIVGKQGKVIGIDVLADMLSEADGRAKRENVSDIVQTMRANLENTPGSSLAAGVADIALVANILHQSDPAKILTEAKRILKPGGSIVVVEWDTAASPFGPPVEKRFSKQSAMQVIQSLGLTIQREFSPSEYHYGLICTI